jgi:hypothetical protein
VPTYTGKVYFTASCPVNSCYDALPGEYQFSTADQGTHTFTNGAILKQAGTRTLYSWPDPYVSGLTGSAQLTVSPAATSTYLLTYTLVNGTPGSNVFRNYVFAGLRAPTTFTVTAEDAYGNTTPDYRGTLRFADSDTSSVVPADYPFTATAAGVHVFNSLVQQTLLGTQSLTLVDANNSSITDNASVTVGAASFSITGQPTAATAGSPFGFTVSALDGNGTVITNYNLQVSLLAWTATGLDSRSSQYYTFTTGAGGTCQGL